MVWVDFFICYFLGIFGVHKFREKNTKMGFLYLFTFGLFGLGWIFDCIKYLIIAVKSTKFSITKQSPQNDMPLNKANTDTHSSIKHCFLSKPVLIVLGCLFLILLLAALGNDGPGADNIDNSVIQSSVSTTSSSPTIQHIHSFAAATCNTPQQCSCGATQGEALGHSWAAATCTTPKTCTICKITDGSPIDHSWKNATCTSPKTCSACGTTTGNKTSHNYKNGKCAACGAKDPNYTSVEMVWIPTKGGTKYHNKSSCSQMDNPKQVTKSEAIAQGYEPCKRCYG